MDPLKRHPRSAIHRPAPARKLDANNVASARKRRRQGPTPLLKPCSVGELEYLCAVSNSVYLTSWSACLILILRAVGVVGGSEGRACCS